MKRDQFSYPQTQNQNPEQWLIPNGVLVSLETTLVKVVLRDIFFEAHMPVAMGMLKAASLYSLTVRYEFINVATNVFEQFQRLILA